MNIRTNNERGTVLITTLIIALLVGIVVAALLVVSQQQNYLTARSRTWSSEIPIAEAGIEEALAHINSRPKTLETNGWRKIGSYWAKTRTNLTSEGYYFTSINKNPTWAPPTITSIGYGRVPLNTNYTQRSVFVQTKLLPPKYGIVAKQQLSMNGNPLINSYDSSNDDWSTNGRYDASKQSDRVGVGVLSSATPAIDTGGGRIYGTASTGPGGTVNGNIGSGEWFAGGNSGSEPDHTTDDFNMAVPNASLPGNFSSTPQTVPLLGAVLGGIFSGFTYVLSPGDWKFGAVNFSSGGIYVQGNVRIWVDGDFRMSSSASVTLAPGATLEMYIGHPTSPSAVQMDLSGNCVINPTGIPANCSIYGLQNCTSMKYSGTSAAYCKLYAPNADIRITGDYDFNGSIVGNYIRFSGNAQIHYDEALAGESASYKVVLWQEL
jgi:Tfp pilus assembly protein PilX